VNFRTLAILVLYILFTAADFYNIYSVLLIFVHVIYR